MPKDITHEADLSLFPMASCITGLTETGGYKREIVTARRIVDASDMFSRLGILGISKVFIKLGHTEVGPVCELLEQTSDSAANSIPSVPGVHVETSHDSAHTMYRLQSEALGEIGLSRLNFANPDELAADDSLFTDRTTRMGGSPTQVAHFIFDNIPPDDIPFFDDPS